jgi:plasmid stabilization system protein ParE
VSARVLKRPRAKVDLLDHFVYIGERGSLEKAEEFLKAVERAFELLAGMPEMGRGVLEPNLRRRIDQKLLAALDRGEALPGEHVMPELRKKHQARA